METDENATTLWLPSGRSLGTAEYGDPAGVPVLFFHGTPGSRFQALPLDGPARRAGVRLVALERPGFGRTEPGREHSFRTWADEVAGALAVLAIERAGVLAVSGGAGFALACAALHPGIVTRLLLVSGAGVGGGGLKARLVRHAPRLVERAMRAQLDPAKMSSKSRERAMAKTSPADAAVAARPDVQAWMTDERVARFAHGVGPAVHEMRAYTRPWGFDLAQVQVPVVLLHGDDDRNVPIERVQALAAQLPRAELRVAAGAGHALLLQEPELVEQALVELAEAGR